MEVDEIKIMLLIMKDFMEKGHEDKIPANPFMN